MVIGLSTFELHLPHAHSLKDKRKVVKGLVDRVHHRFKVSIIESGHHDLRQRAEVTLVLVALTDTEAEQIFDAIRRLIDEIFDAVLVRWDPELMDVHA
ncbi:MAG: DUF503 domain-containing protein [Acidobacteriota bacterium]